MNRFVVEQRVIGNVLMIIYNTGDIKLYDAVELGCEWFRMSNDAFFNKYGFNFVPKGKLYDVCKYIIYGSE